jgi:AraC-like DNA-binding protein
MADTLEEQARILLERDFQKYVLDIAESETPHVPYEAERAVFEPVRLGDVESVKQQIQAGWSSDRGRKILNRVGKVANKSLKQAEYLVCIQISKAQYAAIEGGLDPAKAYAMGDVYLQKLEQCATGMRASYEGIFELGCQVMIGYTTAVRDAKAEASRVSRVEAAKAYIAKHLNVPFTLDELAESIGTSKTHLEHLFGRSCGMSVFRYTQKKRVEAAANLLKYTKQEIVDIAEYLCFSSQSHMGALFKRHLGMTPKEWRNREQVADITETR